VTQVPTRWRSVFDDQLETAVERAATAERHLAEGDGTRALQQAYPAVISAATVQVWIAAPPWQVPLGAEELQRRVRESLPSLFAALAELDVQHSLTSPWQPADAEPYVTEAASFVSQTAEHYRQWLSEE
jgi:hypothetical protein